MGLAVWGEGGDHQLVTTGIYRYIRHPSYLGVLSVLVGWALAFRSGAGLMLTRLTLIPLIGRIEAGEALLRTRFGEQHQHYVAGTWRLVPFGY